MANITNITGSSSLSSQPTQERPSLNHSLQHCTDFHPIISPALNITVYKASVQKAVVRMHKCVYEKSA